MYVFAMPSQRRPCLSIHSLQSCSEIYVKPALVCTRIPNLPCNVPPPPLLPPYLDPGTRRQTLQHLLRIRHSALDDADQAPKGRVRRIPHALVHPALGRGDDDAGLRAQAVERDDHLGPVAAAHGVGNDVRDVAPVAQVEGGLGDADVGLDADEGDARLRRQGFLQGGDEHGELGLVVGRASEEAGEGGDGRAELGDRLRGCVDGHVERFGEVEEFGRRGYDAVEFVYGCAELLLHVADEDGGVLEPQFVRITRCSHGADQIALDGTGTTMSEEKQKMGPSHCRRTDGRMRMRTRGTRGTRVGRESTGAGGSAFLGGGPGGCCVSTDFNVYILRPRPIKASLLQTTSATSPPAPSAAPPNCAQSSSTGRGRCPDISR